LTCATTAAAIGTAVADVTHGARVRETLSFRHALGMRVTIKVIGVRTATSIFFGYADHRRNVRTIVGLVAIINPRVLVWVARRD